jgi:hypothetical protein
LWDTEFVNKRQRKNRQPTQPYKITGERAKAEPGASGMLLGVTVWRLRQPTRSDEQGARILDHNGDTEWAAERVETGTPMPASSRVRITIESPRTGFLYVIDRERYADGSLSEPYLVFPTMRTRGGDNRVVAGRLIELPDQQDRPPYFTLTRSRSNHLGEELIIIVTEQKLPGLEGKIGRSYIKLAASDIPQLAEWEKRLNGSAERIDLIEGAGKPYTREEKEGGGNGERLLTQDEPLPQTIYRVMVKPGEPLLVIVPLRISG